MKELTPETLKLILFYVNEVDFWLTCQTIDEARENLDKLMELIKSELA